MKEIENASLYDELELEENATQQEIKAAFKRLSKQYHPDKNGGNEDKFKRINHAYQILSDEKKRANYDDFGDASGKVDFGQAFAQKVFPIMKQMVHHHKRDLEVDIMAEIEACLRFEINQFTQSIADIKSQINFNDKLKKRFKTKNGAKNVFAEAIKREIKEAKFQVSHQEKLIKFNKRCIENLESYIYEYATEETYLLA